MNAPMAPALGAQVISCLDKMTLGRQVDLQEFLRLGVRVWLSVRADMFLRAVFDIVRNIDGKVEFIPRKPWRPRS